MSDVRSELRRPRARLAGALLAVAVLVGGASLLTPDVTAVETALERQLSTTIMRGGTKPSVRTVKQGRTVIEQGADDTDLFLLLNGVVAVEVDGESVAELGPGAVLGERAALEGGRRTSTVRALTDCKLAVAAADQIAQEHLVELSAGHRREEA